MSLASLPERDIRYMRDNLHACPIREHSISFQLVDELGNGEPYAGLAYQVIDYEDMVYNGILDANGCGKVGKHYCGPVELRVDQRYKGREKLYEYLRDRQHYPLPITELQVRAEKTHFAHKDGVRTQSNPAQARAGSGGFHQVEVSELVEHIAHLPPVIPCDASPDYCLFKLFRPLPVKQQLGYRPELAKRFGVPLLPNKHHVLEVRPLRAFRPMLSARDEFCALNLYQLALMSTLSYAPFGQEPDERPVTTGAVAFPVVPSSGNWFGDALARADEIWKVDSGQKPGKPYYPLYENVPYSKRLEIVPFDPHLYPGMNDPVLGTDQQTPATVHFLDDRSANESSDSQAFITHNDEIILIAVRGTSELPWDLLTDMDARQVPFNEGVGHVHRGFYKAAKVVYEFADNYLKKFYIRQKIIITGHSLGGAIALLLAEMLRRSAEQYNVLLYTYGAPRCADQTFVDAASALTHYRMVNHNDPIPGVPGTHMDTKAPIYGTGLVVSFANAPLGIGLFVAGVSNLGGAPYAHHGTLQHFMPVRFENGHQSSILWAPGCDSIIQHACTEILRQRNGLPTYRPFEPALYILNHLMLGGYIPNSWATLRRWQESHEQRRERVTPREYNWVDNALRSMEAQLKQVAREARSDAYRRAHEKAYEALQVEIGKLRTTRERLLTLRHTKADAADVYGETVARSADFLLNLDRWKNHPVNTAAEQLAMAPPEVPSHEEAVASIIGGYSVGAPYDLDIDSLG